MVMGEKMNPQTNYNGGPFLLFDLGEYGWWGDHPLSWGDFGTPDETMTPYAAQKRGFHISYIWADIGRSYNILYTAHSD